MGTLMYIMWMRKGKRRPSEFARILKDKIIENEGGTKGPRDNRESAKAVWERALSFWSIPKCDWYSDDINHLRLLLGCYPLKSPRLSEMMFLDLVL
jgi:hypothetical protein